MAIDQPRADVVPVQNAHYVDWGAVILGTVIASGLAIVLFTFGSAIGLSMVSPYRGEGASRMAFVVALGLWTVWVITSSFMAGGYMAGRLRRRIGDATEHEVEVRDGSHGLAVWGLGVVVGSLLLAAGISGIAGTAAMHSAQTGSDRLDFTIDSMLRGSDQTARAADNERREIARLLTYGVVHGHLVAENRAYLTQLVATRSGMTIVEAEGRVDKAMGDAQADADLARKGGIIAAFLAASALLIAAAAAAWAATLGGRHRDQATNLSTFWRWR